MNYLENNKIISKFMGSDPNINLNYHSDYNLLYSVIDKIETIDLKDNYYIWEDEEGLHYNFLNVSVWVENKFCDIYINLDLDPPVSIAYFNLDNRKESIYNAILKFIEYYEKINKNS